MVRNDTETDIRHFQGLNVLRDELVIRAAVFELFVGFGMQMKISTKPRARNAIDLSAALIVAWPFSMPCDLNHSV